MTHQKNVQFGFLMLGLAVSQRKPFINKLIESCGGKPFGIANQHKKM
jgi:hypothetical protein